jgi:hypothetical protein
MTYFPGKMGNTFLGHSDSEAYQEREECFDESYLFF